MWSKKIKVIYTAPSKRSLEVLLRNIYFQKTGKPRGPNLFHWIRQVLHEHKNSPNYFEIGLQKGIFVNTERDLFNVLLLLLMLGDNLKCILNVSTHGKAYE